MAPWIIALLVGAGVGAAATIYFWDDIRKWLSNFLPKVANAIREIGRRVGGKFEHVAMVVAKKLDDYASVLHKLYYKDEDGTWTERITERKGLKEDQLPPEVQRKLAAKRKNEEGDITDYIEATVGSVE